MPYNVTKPAQPVLQGYLIERHQSKAPPPKPEEIRRKLGWALNPSNKVTLPER